MVSQVRKEVTDPELLRQLNEVTDQETLNQLNKEMPNQNMFMRGIDRFNNLVQSSHLPDFAGGLLQGAGDIGASLGNLVANRFGYNIPHPDLQQYTDHSLGSKIGFGLGELGAQIPAFSTGSGVLEGLTGLGKFGGLSGKMLLGSATGAALGEEKNGSRKLGAALGLATPLGISIAKGLNAIRSKKIAESVLHKTNEVKESYGSQFKKLFSEVNERKANSGLKPIDVNEKLLNKAGNKNFIYSLKEYNNNPTIENAHTAQSEMAKYSANIGKPVSTLERHAKEEARKIGEDLRAKMAEHLHKTGNIDLALKYSKLREGFKREVAPYLNSKTVSKLQSGEIRPKKFAEKLANDEKFMSQIGEKNHPELIHRELLRAILHHPVTKYGAATALGAVGAHKLSKMID